MKTDSLPKLSAKEILLTMLGTAILSFGVAVFIIPSGIVIGGVSGMSLIINGLFPSISADLSVTVLTWLLFAFGAVVLGKDFALKTLVSAIVYPLGISVFSVLNSATAFGGLFFSRRFTARQRHLAHLGTFRRTFGGNRMFSRLYRRRFDGRCRYNRIRALPSLQKSNNIVGDFHH